MWLQPGKLNAWVGRQYRPTSDLSLVDVYEVPDCRRRARMDGSVGGFQEDTGLQLYPEGWAVKFKGKEKGEFSQHNSIS